ncbi:phage head morphogenesis protein [Clostridiales Family XIII bacterium ASD5510]|uniref:Phage head morphogenesis protein n=1 Tax=Hominibacterium faecale TaxID=2839743 RepID=A0A9J6QYG5_9FIRM|nr:phage minor head protein [Hominibacterium faecale]MCU7380504.1 phage head morphogenesis protein [Hominibacterium faecale]
MPIIFHNEIAKADKVSARMRLNGLINAEEPQLVYFMEKLWKNQGNAITYKELRECIMNGELDQNIIGDWQQDYSKFVVKYMEPKYTKAIEEATHDLNDRFPGRTSFMADKVREYTDNYSASFVTNCTREQTQAIRQLVRRSANLQDMSVDSLARAIRPMIGLNQRQATANMNYYQTMIEGGMSEKQALDKSLRYAAKQHRYRAYAIARTELAFAYNNGEFEGVKQAQRAGLMGRVTKKWCDAADNRVCKVCKALSGAELEMDEWFDFKTRLPQSYRRTPPAHTQCRCVLLFIEKEPPRNTYTTPAGFSTEPGSESDQDYKSLSKLQEKADKANQIVDQYIDIPSKWSGKVKWNDKTDAVAAKDWNCDILVQPEADLHNLIHEQLHARSVSYYGLTTYMLHEGIEELSVELLAREICKAESVEIDYSKAYNLVESLYIINQTLHLSESDIDFAKMLLAVPLPERKEWLRRKIIEHSEDFTTYNDLIKKLEAFDKWRE